MKRSVFRGTLVSVTQFASATETFDLPFVTFEKEIKFTRKTKKRNVRVKIFFDCEEAKELFTEYLHKDHDVFAETLPQSERGKYFKTLRARFLQCLSQRFFMKKRNPKAFSKQNQEFYESNSAICAWDVFLCNIMFAGNTNLWKETQISLAVESGKAEFHFNIGETEESQGLHVIFQFEDELIIEMAKNVCQHYTDFCYMEALAKTLFNEFINLEKAW